MDSAGSKIGCACGIATILLLGLGVVVVFGLFFSIFQAQRAESPPIVQGNTSQQAADNGQSSAAGGKTDLGYPEKADPEKSGNCLDIWMKNQQPSSPLIGHGKTFVTAGKSHDVSPALMVAVGTAETSLATTGLATEGGHNFFGLKDTSTGTFKIYSSWDESITDLGRNLSKYYLYYDGPGGRTETIGQIGAAWAPAGAEDDPTGLNNHWAKNVTTFYNDIVSKCPELSGKPKLPTGDRAELAKAILNNQRISVYNAHVSNRVHPASTAFGNLTDTAAGKPAALSPDCGAGNTTQLSEAMLRGTLALAEQYSFRALLFAGGCHSSRSHHYSGGAIDIDMINGRAVLDDQQTGKRMVQTCRQLGAIEALGPGDAGHSNHVHCAW